MRKQLVFRLTIPVLLALASFGNQPTANTAANLLGSGISEGTALIVTGDRFEVMGAWKVAIHDNTRVYQPWEKPYYVLSAGDVYNMKTRKIEKYGNGAPPRPQPAAGDGIQPRRNPDRF